MKRRNKSKKPKSKALTAAYRRSLQRKTKEKRAKYKRSADLPNDAVEVRMTPSETHIVNRGSGPVTVFPFATSIHVDRQELNAHRVWECSEDKPLIEEEQFVSQIAHEYREEARSFYRNYCSELRCVQVEQIGGCFIRLVPIELKEKFERWLESKHELAIVFIHVLSDYDRGRAFFARMDEQLGNKNSKNAGVQLMSIDVGAILAGGGN